jgi:hypothetical protein
MSQDAPKGHQQPVIANSSTLQNRDVTEGFGSTTNARGQARNA